MPIPFETLEEHETFLTDKGYLSERFMSATQKGYWLKEFTEQYNQCIAAVITYGTKQQFTMPLIGAYNGWLDKMKLELFYYMKPGSDVLSMFMAETSIGESRVRRDEYGEEDFVKRANQRVILKHRGSLPAADPFYKKLVQQAKKERTYNLYGRLKKDFQLNRNPDNDYEPTTRLKKVIRR